jgi:hypothetical protein
MSRYIAVGANRGHLERHFEGSLIPGSKFLPMTEDQKERLLDRVDLMLTERFMSLSSAGKPLTKIIVEMKSSAVIGTDPLIAITPENTSEFLTVKRDAGSVKVMPCDDIPLTNNLVVIAGPYGDTGGWGIYTMFPGQIAPAFPNAKAQSGEEFVASTDFWNNHGFLATPLEIKASLPAAPKEQSLNQQHMVPALAM